MINSDSKRISQAELSRRLGVSRVAVSKAVKSGRITPGEDKLFDSDQAIAEWKSNTRTAMKAEASPGEKLKREKGGQPKYATARARKELANARIAEIKEERLRGLYCLASEVGQVVDEVITDFRMSLERFPGRLAHELAHKDAGRIRAVLQEEVRGILTKLHEDASKKLKECSTPDESEFPSARL